MSDFEHFKTRQRLSDLEHERESRVVGFWLGLAFIAYCYFANWMGWS
jgi:hypothetical protein